MTPRDYLRAYCASHGGIPATAKRLGVSYPAMAGACNGWRGITPTMATRMHKADPNIDKNLIVWIRPMPKKMAADRRARALRKRAQRNIVIEADHV